MRQDLRREFASFAHGAMPELLRYGLLLTGTRSDAEDLVQAALERVLRRWHRLEVTGNPLAYCRVTMARLHVDNWRAFRRRELSVAAVPDYECEDAATRVATSSAVLALLGRLPRRQRTVLVLRFYADMSEEQIAQAMSTTRGTVKSQTAKALAALRESGVAEAIQCP